MEIFRQIGLEAQIQDAGLAPAETALFYFGASLTSPVDFELVSRARAATSAADSPTAGVTCSQEVLEALLRGEAERAASGEALFGVELASFEQHARGVTALLRDRASGRQWNAEAAFMVAADGASTLTCSYGRRVVVLDACLLAQAGEHVALIGANGSGKITLLRPRSACTLQREPTATVRTRHLRALEA